MKREEYHNKFISLNTSTYDARKCFLNIHQTKQSSSSPVQKRRIFYPSEVCKVLRSAIAFLPLKELCKTLACLVKPCIRYGEHELLHKQAKHRMCRWEWSPPIPFPQLILKLKDEKTALTYFRSWEYTAVRARALWRCNPKHTFG